LYEEEKVIRWSCLYIGRILNKWPDFHLNLFLLNATVDVQSIHDWRFVWNEWKERGTVECGS